MRVVIDLPEIPSAITIATLRVAIPRSPGKALNDRAGDTFTSLGKVRLVARGTASGNSIPRPCATACANSSDTFRSDATMRLRIAGSVILLNSKRKPPTM